MDSSISGDKDMSCKWSEDPTEEQLMVVFHSPYAFKVMKQLMQNPSTVKDIGRVFGITNYERIYAAVKRLKKAGLIIISSYVQTNNYSKTAMFSPTIKNLIVTIAKETTITTDTKLVLHDERFE